MWMRPIALGLLFSCLVVAHGCDGGSPATIILLSPNGGETWTEGLPATVTWDAGSYTGNVDVEYSTDSGATWQPLVTGTANDGTEDVTAPGVASDTVRVQVCVADGDPSVLLLPADQSDDDFAIEARIVVTSPNGFEFWEIGSMATVTWMAGSHAGSVDIEYSTDGGATWKPLATDTVNDGAEEVSVPTASTSMARIQVSAADGDPTQVLAPSDSSDADFRIGGPPTDIEAGISGVRESPSLAWGDYDNDGDLDLALAGFESDEMGIGAPISRIYRNDGGSFTDIAAGLPGVADCSLAWGDYDNDGDLDLALAGRDSSLTPISRIYRNDGGSFTDIAAGLPGVEDCSLVWGDYDNDGDLDLVLAGSPLGCRIYRNDGGAFTDIGGAGLPGIRSGSLAWGDYDNDGDLDLALAGIGRSWIYRNDGGSFTDIAAGLPGVADCSLAWGDYDNDGDLDLALAGRPWISRVYRNDGGSFTDIEAGLPGVDSCSLAWGDYDNDGDLDLALAGLAGFGGDPISRIYRNDGGSFTDIAAGLPGVDSCSLAWGDCDNDGDLDLALAGYESVMGVGAPISRIYRNDGGFAPNTRPSAPTDVMALTGGGEVLFSWLPAVDLETPEEGLAYNLRIGKTTSDDSGYPSMADALGIRRIPARGPIAHNQLYVSAWLELPPGVYYVSVQAIDAGFAGGPWSDPFPFSVP